jgi:hypothetical protein
MTVKIYSQDGSNSSIELTPSIDENGDTILILFVEDGRLGGDYFSVDVSNEDLIELSKYLNDLIKED